MKLKVFFVGLILFFIFNITGCDILFDLSKMEVPAASIIYDSNGQTISTVFEQNRIPVPIEEVSPYFLKAIVAIEDHRFFQHQGVDLQAIARAFIKNLKARATVEGGSTITQQTAKVLFLSPERTYSRKLKELILTYQLERRFTKREILEKYINLIYFGHGAYGIETAAETYFNKSAKDLTLSESAVLAGLVKGPAFYSPITKPKDAKDRQNIVLKRMVELEIITEAEAQSAKEEKLLLVQERKKNRRAPFFTTMIIEEITKAFEDGSELLHRGGLAIHTSLDLNMQKAAEQAFVNGLKDYDNMLEGALVALDPHSGYIKALVGGRDFNKSQLNRAIFAKRQPGSAFKPFLYAAAIDQGYTAAATFLWEPVSYDLSAGDSWQPTEYNNRQFHGQTFTLQEALARSSNIISAKLINEVTPEVAARYAKQMGIESDMRPLLSLALGTSEVNPLEIISAYGTLAANGIKAKPIFITKIVDSEGRVILENRPQSEVAISQQTAYIVTNMLQDVITSPIGTAHSIRNIINSRPAAGKTGTTNDLKDAWFIGYTPELVAGVYLGYDDNKTSVGATGGTIAAPIWANFIAQALKDVPPTKFAVPRGLVSVEVCSDSGLLATSQSPRTVAAVFLIGTEPTKPCPVHRIVLPEENFPRQRDNWLDRFFNWQP